MEPCRSRALRSRPPNLRTSFAATFIAETIAILEQLDLAAIERMALGLAQVREAGGRLFILGVGGSAAHASHAVNDFRKLCGFEAYAPTDNVSELTARANDDGWETCFAGWLVDRGSAARDGVLVFSVGGGSREKNVSVNIVRALETAASAGAHIFGIVGRDGGFTRQVAEECVVIPTGSAERVTPHTEGLCAVVWHLLVSHPLLQRAPAKWESRDGVGPMTGASSFWRAAPASSAATSPTGCCATAACRTVTLYDNFSSGREWHYAQHEPTRGCA